MAWRLAFVAGPIQNSIALCAEASGEIGKSMMSMNTDAGPSAPDRSPSITLTLNARLLPSSFGEVRTTTALLANDVALLKTDTVALGGTLAKLPLPGFHSSSK